MWDSRIKGLRGQGGDDDPPVYEDHSTEHPAPDPTCRSMEDLRRVMDQIRDRQPAMRRHPLRRGGSDAPS
jgi:hypothetical protein